MDYICIKRFKGLAIDGNVDIAVGTDLTCENKIIKRKTKKICVSTSDNAHTYFMRNDDGYGTLRGELIDAINMALTTDPTKYEKIYKDPICQAYKKDGHDMWIWNHAFFNTTVETLTYIKNLVVEEENHDESK